MSTNDRHHLHNEELRHHYLLSFCVSALRVGPSTGNINKLGRRHLSPGIIIVIIIIIIVVIVINHLVRRVLNKISKASKEPVQCFADETKS